jgi:glycosyltransferase involved in cell wall biosynthesis
MERTIVVLSPMNILIVVPTYKPAYIYGGPAVVIALLAETLVRMGHTVTVYTTTANGRTELDVPVGQKVIVDGVHVTYFRRITGDHTQTSPDLWRRLWSTVRDFDVVHLHSWWNVAIMGAAWVCQQRGVIPVLSPHGMLSSYILTANNSAKKQLLHWLFGQRLLRRTRLHVSTEQELQESHQIVPNWPGRVIPNPVTLPVQAFERATNPVFTIGFLSRIDPKKGLDILIRALAHVNFPYRLLIAGDGEASYISSLKALAHAVGNTDRLEWVGWQQGDAKFTFLASLDLFALTSHSENFAIVVIEALAAGTPVLISDQVGLHAFVTEYDYGWVTPMSEATITNYLNQLVADRAKADRIAATAPAAIRAAYQDTYLAQQYVDFYQSLPH